MSQSRVFLWGAVAFAGLMFVGAIGAGATWATRFRASGDDSAKYDELLDEAVEKLENGDVSGARRLTERVLAIDPNDPVARSNLGRIFKGQGDYARAIAEHKLAIAADPELPDLYYNVACYYALMKRSDDAFEWLVAAFDHGYGRREGLRNDPDFESLRADPRFDQIARTGKLPTGIPRIRVHSARQAAVGKSFEVSVIVERDVRAPEAAAASKSVIVTWTPDSPLELVSTDVQTVATPGDGMVNLRTTVRYVVRGPRAGLFSLAPVKVEGAGKVVESDAGVVEILSEGDPGEEDE